MPIVALPLVIVFVQQALGSDFGIFVDISEEDLLQASGITCGFTAYSAAYSHPTSIEDIYKPTVGSSRKRRSADTVLVGARWSSATHSKYAVVGLGPYEAALTQTFSEDEAYDRGGGAFWYRVDGKAFGFAPTPDISLGPADKEVGDCERRMSWHLDNDLGGWSAGCNRGMMESQWQKVVKYCNRTSLGLFFSQLNGSPEFSVVQMQPWSSATDGMSSDVIRFGAVLTLDCCSKYSKAGLMMERSYEIFVEWVNSVRGGILVGGVRHMLHLSLIDDRSDIDRARIATEQLVRSGNIQLLLGPYGSDLADGSARVVNATGAVLITPHASEDYVHMDYPRVFGMSLLSNETFTPIVAEMARHGARSVAIIREEGYAPAACDAIPALADQWNLTVAWDYKVNQDTYNTMSADFDVVLSLIRSKPPDVVLSCLPEEICQLLYEEVSLQKVYARAFVFIECATSAAWLEEFGSAGQFVIGMTPWVPGLQTGPQITGLSAQEFVAEYESRFNTTPSDEAASTWAAAMAMLVAVESADSTDPDKVEQALRDMDIETAYGRVKFNSDGRNTRSWTALQYVPSSQEAHIVAPAGSKTAELEYPAPSWHTRVCFERPVLTSRCSKGVTSAGECSECNSSDVDAFWNETLGGCECRPFPCPPGHIVDSSGTCLACALGRFSESVMDTRTCLDCEVGSYANESGKTACDLCPPGKYTSTVRQTSCEACAPGRASTTEGLTSCVDCDAGRSVSQAGASHCFLCQPGTFTAGRGQAACEACAPGRSSGSTGMSCVECEIGKYQLQSSSSACMDCPEGTACTGNGTIFPKNMDNWWQFESRMGESWHQTWLPCPVAGRCKADQRCATGHTGVLCAVCLPDYSRPARRMRCKHCGTNSGLRVFRRMLFFLGSVFLTYLVTAAAVAATETTKLITDTLLKLLLNYFTTITVTASVFQFFFLDKVFLDEVLSDDSSVDSSYDLIRAILKFSPLDQLEYLLDADCLFQPELTDTDENRVWLDVLATLKHNQTFAPGDLAARAYQDLQDFHWIAALRRFVFWFFTPVLLTVSCMLIGLIRVLWHLLVTGRYDKRIVEFLDAVETNGFEEASRGLDQEQVEYFLRAPSRRLLGVYPAIRYARIFMHSGTLSVKDFCIDSQPLAVVGFFLIYPALLQTLFQPLNCENPLYHHLDAVGSETVMAASNDLRCYQVDDVLFWFSVLGITIYVGAIPSLAGYYLYQNRQSASPQFRKCWRFMVSGYEQDMIHWECIVLVRKAVTVCFATINMNSGWRAAVLLLEATGFSVLHVLYRPFDNRYNELLDRVECRHLLVWLCFALMILWCYVDAAKQEVRNLADGRHEEHEASVVYITGFSMCVLHIWFIGMICRQIINHGTATYAAYLLKSQKTRAQFSMAVKRDMSPKSTSSKLQQSNTTKLNVLSAMSYASHSKRLQMEVQCFGGLAAWRWSHYLSRKCHIFCDAGCIWFKLSGRRSNQVAHVPFVKCTNEVEFGTPADVNDVRKASEKQRRYFLSIMSDAFEHIIVNQEIVRFPISLWEFILRVGFAFDQDHCPRAMENSAEDDQPMYPSSPRSGTGLGEFTRSSRRSFAENSDSSNEGDAARAELELEIQLHKAIGDSQSKEGARSSAGRASLTRLSAQEESEAVLALTDSSQVAIDDRKLATLTNDMFRPEIFNVGLSLEEFQQNLDILHSMSRDNLVRWLAHFEMRWKNDMLQRLQLDDRADSPDPKQESQEGPLNSELVVSVSSDALDERSSAATVKPNEVPEDVDEAVKQLTEELHLAPAQANWVRFTAHLLGAQQRRNAFQLLSHSKMKSNSLAQAQTTVMHHLMQEIESMRLQLATALKDAVVREASSIQDLQRAEASRDYERIALDEDIKYLYLLRQRLLGHPSSSVFEEAEVVSRRHLQSVAKPGGDDALADAFGPEVRENSLASDRTCFSNLNGFSDDLPELTRDGFTGEGFAQIPGKPRATRSCSERVCGGRS